MDGHISRMPQNRIPYVSLNWKPSRKRKKGRPTTTWRSTVKNELEEKRAAKDRDSWRLLVEASCSSSHLKICVDDQHNQLQLYFNYNQAQYLIFFSYQAPFDFVCLWSYRAQLTRAKQLVFFTLIVLQ
jgi:hypothetical protein